MDEIEREQPDMRGPAIVVRGSVLVGFKFYGPFATIDAAVKWYGQTVLGELTVGVVITLLEKPDAAAIETTKGERD